MAPIKWHQCTPPPCPPLSPLSPWRRRAALPPSRLPPLSSRLLLPHLSLHLLHGRPMAAGGAGRGGRGQEEEGNRVVPGGADTSHCPPRRARLSPDRHGSARPRVEPGHRGGLGQAGSRRGAVAGGRRCCPGLQRGPCPPSHPSCRRHSCSPRPLRVTVSTATAAAAAPGHGLHGNSCCRRCCTDSASTSCTAPPPWSLGVQPCAHCVCQNRPFQELQKTFLASFFHLQDQKGKRGFCNWEAGEESGGPRFPLDIWVLPAEFAALGVVFVELGPALLRRRQGLEGGRENQEQVSPSIFL
ncbi:uncharacterized protein [Melopsittacus undulatus]|uniref:uncharacterized protein isoform X2 n=1 Tax=Melopsittacus undulatus TaxID=13146 RepID=UPI00146C2EC7|nr:uncharacterized protein LOC117438423 isoform X2 [Melopsittacus undulatus]